MRGCFQEGNGASFPLRTWAGGPSLLVTPPASSLPSAHAVEEQDGGGGCPEMGEVPERMPEGRKDRKEGCPTRCLNARALAPVRVLTLPVARGPSG